MVRPEHVSWTKNEVCEMYTGEIKHVTYVGERYEIKVNMGHSEYGQLITIVN